MYDSLKHEDQFTSTSPHLLRYPTLIALPRSYILYLTPPPSHQNSNSIYSSTATALTSPAATPTSSPTQSKCRLSKSAQRMRVWARILRHLHSAGLLNARTITRQSSHALWAKLGFAAALKCPQPPPNKTSTTSCEHRPNNHMADLCCC